MSQRRDDTTDPHERAPTERAPRNYYYDDATGYELYDPAQDEDEPAAAEREDEADEKDQSA